MLARLGSLEVRLARSEAEREAAFALRHAVFCTEMGASLPGADPVRGIETDRFDPFCDHIIVCDTALADDKDGTAPVVGAYRAMRPQMAVEGFYSRSEFDIGPLFGNHPGLSFCEVGRSCVAATHRSMRAIEALWCGLWAYAARHGIDVYFGAASFPGTDPCAHAPALSFLHHHVGAPRDWSVEAIGPTAIAMDLVKKHEIDPKAAIRAMPPLIRGYMRVNAHVGRTAYIDRQFGTIDVMIVTPLRAMPAAYQRRFISVTNRRLPG